MWLSKNTRWTIGLMLVMIPILSSAQNKLYLPIPIFSDTSYIFEIKNPSKIDVRIFDDPKTWYLDRSITPCFKLNYKTEYNADVNWKLREDEYKLSLSGITYSLKSVKGDDPFWGVKSEMFYEENPEVIKDVTSMKGYQKFEHNVHIEYRTKDLPEEIRSQINESINFKIRILAKQTVIYTKDGFVRVVLPHDNSINLVLNEKQIIIPTKVELYESGAWNTADALLSKKIISSAPPFNFEAIHFFNNYVKEESAYLIMETGERDKVASGYYQAEFHNNQIPYCEPDTKNMYVFPNPSFGNFYVQSEGFPEGDYNFVLYNIIGKKLQEVPMQIINGETVEIRLQGLNKGTYIYSIEDLDGNRLQTKRLMIMSI